MNEAIQPDGSHTDPSPASTEPSTFDSSIHTDVEPAPPPRPDAQVADREPRPTRQGGRSLAGLLGASLLSAVLASTGTAAVLVGAAGPATTPAPTANSRAVTTGTQAEDITAVVATAR